MADEQGGQPVIREVLVGTLRAYSRVVELLMATVIIVSMIAFLYPRYIQARQAALVTTCLEKLRELGLALDMYAIDYGAYPPSENWYRALRANIGPIKAKVEPLKCRADPTPAPTSYYYLDDSLLPPEQRTWPSGDVPWLVDELHHPLRATILWRDGHLTAIDKLDWSNLRSERYHIRQDVRHPDWYRFVPASPARSETGLEEAAGER